MESQIAQMNYIQYWTNLLSTNQNYIVMMNEIIQNQFEDIRLQYSNLIQINNLQEIHQINTSIPLSFNFNSIPMNMISNNPNVKSQMSSNDHMILHQDSNSNHIHPNINICSSRAKLIAKYNELKNDKSRKSKFIALYKSKEKMHRIDCMTRKINTFYHQFLVDNSEKYQIDQKALDELKTNLRFTSKQKFLSVNAKYPFFRKLYEVFLNSNVFSQLILAIKCKYDKEYLKLFYNHAHNFIWLNETANTANSSD